MKLLVDHDIEGYTVLLWGSLIAEGWLELAEINFVMFTTVGLAFDSNDRDVWRFAQANGMVLLTSNRNMQDNNSLEQTIRQENTTDSLPVITISDVQRLDKKFYRDRCIARLVEIALDLDNYLGTGRIFVP
ncbi:MAG: ACP S-malonyltransferase [Candidatus Competibacteraceae bacterium]